MFVSEQRIDVTLPLNSVKMLFVQPHLEFQGPIQEPFPLRQECIQRLLDVVDNVFLKARTYHPHMVLFPEFALPGVAGVEKVVACLSSETVSSPTIVIAGVHGLSTGEYARLCALANVSTVDSVNEPSRVRATEWVNTSVTFVKDDGGRLSLWIQPKISPSGPEGIVRHQSMFQGGAVRIFRAEFDNRVPCRFFSLLCFDWIGVENSSTIPDTILHQFNTISQELGCPQDIQWAFVLQHNDSPNHTSFLSTTNRFLTHSNYPFVRRQDAAVVMVCTASSRIPARGRGGPYGYSSLIFSPRAPFDSHCCQPTFATQSSRLRKSTDLGTCKDVVFREMGECIHWAEVRVPNFVTPDVTDRTAALVIAEAIPLLGEVIDPRIPGSIVPAVVKWTNDELDTVPDLVARYFTGTTIEGQLRTSQNQMIDSYRKLRSQDLALRIDGACAIRAPKEDSNDDPATDVDPAADVDTAWDADERSSLHNVIHTLTLIGAAAALDTVGSILHARCEACGVEIATIYGSMHSLCMKAFNRLAKRTHSPIVFVSRDDYNAPLLEREIETFADPLSGTGVKYTDYQTIFMAARNKGEPEYRQFITELLNVQDRRFF